MSEELKPCPRCGPKGKAISCCKTISGLIVYSVACVECGLKTLLYSTKAKAAENWNARPLEDALQARIEALEVKAKALDLLVEMARAGEMIEIHEDAGMFFVQSYHYSDDLPTAIAAAYTAWKEE